MLKNVFWVMCYIYLKQYLYTFLVIWNTQILYFVINFRNIRLKVFIELWVQFLKLYFYVFLVMWNTLSVECSFVHVFRLSERLTSGRFWKTRLENATCWGFWKSPTCPNKGPEPNFNLKFVHFLWMKCKLNNKKCKTGDEHYKFVMFIPWPPLNSKYHIKKINLSFHA